MIHRVEVTLKEQFGDPHAEGVLAQIRELGIDSVSSVRSRRLFFLAGDLDEQQAGRIGAELLADPVIEQCRLGEARAADGATVIEVHLKAGVMDPVAASAEKAIRDMGVEIEAGRTARRYELAGRVGKRERVAIARRLLANDVIVVTTGCTAIADAKTASEGIHRWMQSK